MDPQLVQVLTPLLTALGAYAFTLLARLALEDFGVDLSQFQAAAVQLVVNVALAFAAGLLAQFPANLQPIIVQLILLILGVLVVHKAQGRRLALNGQ